MDLKKLSKLCDDARSEERYQSLKERGVGIKHYLNQIEASKGDKKIQRAQTFYSLAKEDNPQLAEAIKRIYPDIYVPAEEIEEERRVKEEVERKAREEEEAKDPINILKKNMEETKHAPTYGMSDEQVSELEQALYKKLVPMSGRAFTLAGEMLRAWEDLMYRWYNDGDWFVRGGAWSGDETFNPRSVSNMKFLTSHGAEQISYFFHNTPTVEEFVAKVQRMLLNQIIKQGWHEIKNTEDSRTYWRK